MDSTCGKCNSSCLTCDNPLTCLNCKKGWAWNFGLNQCDLCEFLIEGCETCLYDVGLTSYQCTKCSNGFYLGLDYNCHMCSLDLTGCQFCNDSLVCVLCLDGYYLKPAFNVCDKCSIIAGCQLCNDSNVCL